MEVCPQGEDGRMLDPSALITTGRPRGSWTARYTSVTGPLLTFSSTSHPSKLMAGGIVEAGDYSSFRSGATRVSSCRKAFP